MLEQLIFQEAYGEKAMRIIFSQNSMHSLLFVYILQAVLLRF